MKKVFKTFIMLVAVLTVALAATTVKADSGVTLTQKTYITYNGRTEAKFYTSKGYGYCITPEKTGANQGHYFSYSYDEKDGGLLWLLEKGAGDDKTYLITQLAIWKYRSNFMPAAFVNTAYGNEANKLATAAKSHKSDASSNTVKITLNEQNVSASLGDDGYYKTSYMSAKTTGTSTYTVKVSGVSKFEIINASGKTISNGATLKNNEKFYIRIPYGAFTTKTTITATLAASGTEKYVKRYSPNNNVLQDIVVLEKYPKDSSIKVNLVITPTVKQCAYYNGKYYDKNGKETDKVTYQQQCEKNICKKVGDKYFGKDGKEVDKTTYQQQCEKNICKKVGNKYYGKDGKEVDKTTYQQQCEKNICKKVGDKYYGKDGREIDQLTFEQECGNNVCKKVGNKYYGLDGKETDEITYKQQCETNICGKVGDKYFGKDGLEVTYEVYKAECEVPVPDTGVSSTKTILSIIFGILVIAGTVIGIKKYNK